MLKWVGTESLRIEALRCAILQKLKMKPTLVISCSELSLAQDDHMICWGESITYFNVLNDNGNHKILLSPECIKELGRFVGQMYLLHRDIIYS